MLPLLLRSLPSSLETKAFSMEKKTRDGKRKFSFSLIFSTFLGLSVHSTASTSVSIHDFNRYFFSVEFKKETPKAR